MKWIYRFFVFMGIVFSGLLTTLGYLFVADPFHIKPLITLMLNNTVIQGNDSTLESPDTKNDTEVTKNNVDNSATAGAKNLSTDQLEALSVIGIPADSIPAKFTQTQINCFVGVLGQTRVDAIVKGDVPTVSEFYQARECL
jgi:hypothetical protein